jgi:hypothetical protein
MAYLDAAYPGCIPHDFRRTAARNLERIGVGMVALMVGMKAYSIYATTRL